MVMTTLNCSLIAFLVTLPWSATCRSSSSTPRIWSIGRTTPRRSRRRSITKESNSFSVKSGWLSTRWRPWIPIRTPWSAFTRSVMSWGRRLRGIVSLISVEARRRRRVASRVSIIWAFNFLIQLFKYLFTLYQHFKSHFLGWIC